MNLIIVTYYHVRIRNATSRVLDYYSTIDNEKWVTNFILANFINLLFTFCFFHKKKKKKKKNLFLVIQETNHLLSK
jgi:hypothetical protein